MVNASFLRGLATRGWTYVEHPDERAVHGLNCPPFGRGYQRRVVDQIVGTSGLGVPFQALRYTVDAETPDFSRIVLLRLDHPMPPFFVSLPQNPRVGVVGYAIPNTAGLLVVSPDPTFATAVLEVIQPALVRWAKTYPISLSIDGDSLVGMGAPVDPDQLAVYIETLDDIAAALSQATSLDRFTWPKPAGMSFYQRPNWIYRTRDDSMLYGAQLTSAGTNHAAQDVVDVPERGLWFTAFKHTYETQSSDSDGHSSTTYHRDPVGRMLLPFRFGVLANKWNGYGDPLAFFGGLEDYSISSPDPVFATTVVQSARDLLQRARLPRFVINGNQLQVQPVTGSPEEIEHLAWSFVELFSLVPDPVWQRLGLPANPVPRSLR